MGRSAAPRAAARPCRGNSRFTYTKMTGNPVEIIAGASGCMDLPRTRGMPALRAAAATIHETRMPLRAVCRRGCFIGARL